MVNRIAILWIHLFPECLKTFYHKDYTKRHMYFLPWNKYYYYYYYYYSMYRNQHPACSTEVPKVKCVRLNHTRSFTTDGSMKEDQKLSQTRMHSSRMRTVRNSSHLLVGGVCSWRGVWSRGCGLGGASSRGRGMCGPGGAWSGRCLLPGVGVGGFIPACT